MKIIVVSAGILLLACSSSNTKEKENQTTATDKTVTSPAQITTEGEVTKGTLTCLIDGKPFKATFAGATIESKLSDGILQVAGFNDKDAIELILTDKEAKTGASITGEGGVGFNTADAGKMKSYVIMPDAPANIKIQNRTATQVSGTFSFTALDDVSGGKIKVTDGKFDVNIEKEE
jgi:hypothetical protein